METHLTYLTKAKLKEKGWTDGMVKKFLGEPDMTKPNPYYKSAAPMGLYDIKRVAKVERSAKFKEELEKSSGRKQSAQKAVKTKKDKAVEYAKMVEVHLPQMDYNKVLEMACDSYNGWHQYDRNGFPNVNFIPADPLLSDEEFLQRIATNYLRHECTSYEKELYKLFGKTGVHEAHDILQKRINAEIVKTYPQLKPRT